MTTKAYTMTAKATADFANVPIDDVYRIMSTSTNGLTEDEAKRRISELGYNELSEKRKNPILDFIARYWGPMPWLLELTMVLSYIIGHYLEVVIVFVLLTTNAIIGFHHTRSSQRALELLKKRLAIKAKVLRNIEWIVRDPREIVPNIWNVKRITLASLVIGAFLVVEGAAIIFIGTDYYHMELGTLQTFVLLTLIFTSQFRVLIVRERGHFWSSRPGRELALSSLGTVVGFALLGIYGVILPPVTIIQVLLVLGFSAIFTLAVDFPKYYTFRKFGL